MHIAIVIDNLKMGGAQKLVTTFISAASAQKSKITVISLHTAFDSSILEAIQLSGVPVVMFPSRSLFNVRRFAQLIRFFRQQKIDVIHAHLEYSIILSSCVGAVLNIPVVASLHNVRHLRWHVFEKILLNCIVKHVIAVGPAVAEAYRSGVDRKQIKVMVNPVSPIPPISMEERYAIRTEISGDASRPLLISVGRLSPQKGFSDLIAAMEIVHRIYPRVCLAIVGTGSLLKDLQDQIDLSGLQENVRLLGVRADVPRLLAASDIFVMSSHWEGMPVAMLEAMSAGLPVVATGVGDVPQIVSKEVGILVMPHQPEALAEALIKFLKNPGQLLQMGLAARSYVLQNHDSKAWADRLLVIYESV